MKPRFTTANETVLAYATPIRRHHYTDLQEFNRTLAEKIMAMRERLPSKKYSNVGGWHSETSLLQMLGEPYSSQLGRMFMENVRAAVEVMVELSEPLPSTVTIESWANVNMKGDANDSHIHGGCPWSGVYYVSTDTGKDVAGNLIFTDPRTAALMVVHPYNVFKGDNRINIAAEAGVMVVFPSFLYHGVQPYQGTTPRISIAFNLR